MKLNKQSILLVVILLIGATAYLLIPNFEREEFNSDIIEDISNDSVTINATYFDAISVENRTLAPTLTQHDHALDPSCSKISAEVDFVRCVEAKHVPKIDRRIKQVSELQRSLECFLLMKEAPKDSKISSQIEPNYDLFWKPPEIEIRPLAHMQA